MGLSDDNKMDGIPLTQAEKAADWFFCGNIIWMVIPFLPRHLLMQCGY